MSIVQMKIDWLYVIVHVPVSCKLVFCDVCMYCVQKQRNKHWLVVTSALAVVQENTKFYLVVLLYIIIQFIVSEILQHQ